MGKGFFLFRIKKRKTLVPGDIAKMLKSSEEVLESSYRNLDKINVFPVPDGDTGTNLYNTVRGINNSSDILSGALENARGNSGMIFSQFLIGFLSSMPEEARIGDVAACFRKGYESALSILDEPREGTMITVMRRAAEVMEEWKGRTDNITKAFAVLIKELRGEVERTKEMMDVLKKSGVVDSGALGFFYIMEGWNKYLGGKPSKLDEFVSEPVMISHIKIEHRYGTQILIETEKESSEMWRIVKPHGTDVRTIGRDGRVKIHIHTNRPERLAKVLEEHGVIVDMRIEDMVAMRGSLNAGDYYRRVL